MPFNGPDVQNRSGHNENVLPDRLSSDENGGLIQKQQNRIVCLLIVGALPWRLETPHLSGGVTLKFCCLHGRVSRVVFVRNGLAANLWELDCRSRRTILTKSS